MNYELAKQLKDAGFPNNPFRKNEMCPCSDNTVERDGTWICQCKEFIQEPTLSELISVCGSSFHELTYDGKLFNCRMDYMDMNGTFGLTPEEAVAKWYIALNDKTGS